MITPQLTKKFECEELNISPIKSQPIRCETPTLVLAPAPFFEICPAGTNQTQPREVAPVQAYLLWSGIGIPTILQLNPQSYTKIANLKFVNPYSIEFLGRGLF